MIAKAGAIEERDELRGGYAYTLAGPVSRSSWEYFSWERTLLMLEPLVHFGVHKRLISSAMPKTLSSCDTCDRYSTLFSHRAERKSPRGFCTKRPRGLKKCRPVHTSRKSKLNNAWYLQTTRCLLLKPSQIPPLAIAQAQHARVPQIGLHLTQPWSVWTPHRRPEDPVHPYY